MKGLSTAITAIILTIITLVAMLGVFGFYSSYFSGVSANVSQQAYLISLSKMISFQVSQLTFYGIQPALKYFNVSYLLWVSAPLKDVTVVIFNTTEQPLSSLYYYAPTAENTYPNGIFTSSGVGYSPINYFYLSGSVYLPQGGQLLANLDNVRAFNISTNTSYILSAKIPANNIIVIWVLYNYLGKWYRLDYTYINPASNGLGVYIVSNCGYYLFPISTQPGSKGSSIGFWFEDIANTTNATVLSYTYLPSSSSGFVTVSLNQTIVNGRAQLILNVSTSGFSTQKSILYLNQGQWYFVTINQNLQFNGICVYVYEPGNLKPIAEVSVPGIPPVSAMYQIKFGDQNELIGVSQAYYALPKNPNAIISVDGVPQIAGVFTDVFENGFYYNNTANMNSVFNQGSLNLLVYWDFSIASYPLPTNIPGYVWIQGSKTNPQLIYSDCQKIYPFALDDGWQVDPNDPMDSIGFWFYLPKSNGNNQIQIANFTLYNTSIPVKIINDVYIQKDTLVINITYIEIYGLYESSGGPAPPGPPPSSSNTYYEGSITITVTCTNNVTNNVKPGDIVVGKAIISVTGLSPDRWYFIDIIDAAGQAYAFLANSTQEIYGSGGVPPSPGAPPNWPWQPAPSSKPPSPPPPGPLKMPQYFANLNDQLLFNLSATLNQNLVSQAFYAGNMPNDDNTTMLYNFTVLMYNNGPTYNLYSDLYWGIEHAIATSQSATYQGRPGYYLGHKTISDVVYWYFVQSTQATIWYWAPPYYSALVSYTKLPTTQYGYYLYYKEIV